jgi:hypothetical protein
MRVNIHPEPIGNFNFNLPFISSVYLTDYTDPFKKFQKAGITDITLVNNGEPPTRLYAAQSYLAKHNIETKIELLPALYNGPDQIFRGKGYTAIPGAIPGCSELIRYYLDVYQQLEENINQLANADIFYGFKKANHRHWYHYGLAMPDTTCPMHLHIRKMSRDVFWSYAQSLSNFLGYTKQDIADRLLLRLNHTSPGQYRDPVKKIFIGGHWDTSVVTGSLYTNYPGQLIRVGNDMIPVETFYNQEQETFLIPGMDYCDEFETMTEPTWHEVIDNCNNQDRVSVVAFLKRRRFRE